MKKALLLLSAVAILAVIPACDKICGKRDKKVDVKAADVMAPAAPEAAPMAPAPGM